MTTPGAKTRPLKPMTEFGAVETLLPRRTFGPRRRELLGLPLPEPSVDAMTAELRERIAAASNTNLISSLLLRR